jgi:hypothetical protein
MALIFRMILFILVINCPSILYSQQFFRIKAEFSIKSKGIDGSQQLTMGTVYYDKTSKKIVYITKFPEKEIWVSSDTVMYKIADNKVIIRQKIPAIAEFTIFHLSLNGQLADFGLKNSTFKMDKVEKDKDLIITTWLPPDQFKKFIGKIMISNKEKKLQGIIFFNSKGEILTKQFFSKYINVKGFEFPGEIAQISYLNGKEGYEMTTYKNIIINDFKEDHIYNYSIPKQ